MNPNQGDQPKPSFKEGVVGKAQIAAKSIASEKHPDHNEDRFFHFQRQDGVTIAGVFDGVGGYNNGELAAKVSAEIIQRELGQMPTGITAADKKGIKRVSVEDLVKKSLLTADQAVRELAKAKGKMGSTGSVVAIVDADSTSTNKKAIVGNIGDSRVYRMRNGKLERMTLDDNKTREGRADKDVKDLQDKLDNAASYADLNEEELSLFHDRRYIGQGFGGSRPVTPNLYSIDLASGDKLLLVTDGISDNLTTAEIESILALNRDPSTAMDRLVQASLERSRMGAFRSKRDDMTGLIIEISPQELQHQLVRIPTQNQEPVQQNQGERSLAQGSAVRVKGLRGEMEYDWLVTGPPDKKGLIPVFKANGPAEGFIRQVPATELWELNKPTTVEDIQHAGTYDDLRHILGKLASGGLQGSQQFYSNEVLTTQLDKILAGEISETTLTSEGGLRQKFIDIREMEKHRKELRL